MTTFIIFSTYFLTGSSDYNSRSGNFVEILSNLGAVADQFLDENQLKYLIGLLKDKINKDQRVKNQEFSDIDEDFHGFSDIKPHIHVPEIVQETVSETVLESVREIVPGTAQWWASFHGFSDIKPHIHIPEIVPETVLETVSESVPETTPVSENIPLTVTVTFSDTIPADKSRPKKRTRTRRRRKPKWLRTSTTNVGWNTPTGFYYNQTS